jgi:hypothetical protein
MRKLKLFPAGLMPVQKTISMSGKKNILIALALVIIAGIIYIYREYNRTNTNVANESAAYTVEANKLIKEFMENDSLANKKYVGKIISVKGNVKDINQDGNGYYTLSLGESGSLSSIRCSIDSIYSETAKSVKPGMNVQVKGNCTGYNQDELLGLDIIFNRCLIVNK